MKIFTAGSQGVRRASAFGIDAAGFAVLAWLVCRGLDRSVKIDFPPHQAAKAASRIVPAVLMVWAAWFVAPTAIWRATLGKKLLGLEVVAASDGSDLDLKAIIIRETICKWLSLAMNGAGLIDGLITGRAFHDRIAGSAVVDANEAFRGEDEEPWPAVAWPAVAVPVVATALIFWSIRTNGFIYRILWNGAFYLPHEAGHLVVGLVFPHLVGVAAGAWGQLLFPSIATVVFARNKWPVQLAGSLVWLGFSLFDIGQYAGDAWYRELALPVASGDELSDDHLDGHDWWQMLSAARILRYAQPIGESIGALGWVSVGLATGLLVVLAGRQSAVRV